MGSFKKFNELIETDVTLSDDELCEEFGIPSAERQKRLQALKKKMDVLRFNRANSKPVKGVSVDKGKPVADQKKDVADFNKQYSKDLDGVSFDDGKPSADEKKKLADFNKTYGKR